MDKKTGCPVSMPYEHRQLAQLREYMKTEQFKDCVPGLKKITAKSDATVIRCPSVELTGVKSPDLSGLLNCDLVSLNCGRNLLEQVGSFLHDEDFDTRLPRALA